MRQVAHDEPVGLPSVLVQDEDVGEVGRARRCDEVCDDGVAAVDALGGGEEEAQLLAERGEARGGVAGGGEEDARVGDGGVGVLIVDVGGES